MTKMTRISKRLSYLLRHHPEDLELELDSEGFTRIDITELAEKMNITEDIIKNIVKNDEKQRFTITDNRIRANYGHTIPLGKTIYKNQEPMKKGELPKKLYHGTRKEVLVNIKREGLQSQQRQFVHLSYTKDWAKKVGSRREGDVVVLEIDISKCLEDGMEFYDAGPVTILVEEIPPEYIKFNK